jgi:hypothetical protein
MEFNILHLLLVFLVTVNNPSAAQTIVTETRCPEGFDKVGDSNCYAVYDGKNEKRNWDDAQTTCHYRNGYLAEPKTKDEVEQLKNYLKNGNYNCDADNSYYIGGKEIGEEQSHKFKWVTADKPISFSDWYGGGSEFQEQPNNQYPEDVITLYCKTNWEWFDESAKHEYSFICEAFPIKTQVEFDG